MEIPPPKHHTDAFLKIVDDAKARIREITIDQYREMLQSGRPSTIPAIRRAPHSGMNFT